MVEFPPLISVVIGCHHDGPALSSTLDSIAAQQDAPAWECLLVANGPFQASDALCQRLAADPRFRLLHSPNQGLTEALILGCRQARGTFIARIDAGDAMAPQRLRCQAEALAADPAAVLCSSAVQECGPAWEPIRINHGRAVAAEAHHIDVPHHASVLFRRDGYEAVGGYRPAFYYGQDRDLWSRLAELGAFLLLSEPLTCIRLQVDGISSRHSREQVKILGFAIACQQARARGASEQPFLEQAAQIRPILAVTNRIDGLIPWDGRRANGAYFIAEALRRNKDRRCYGYFCQALWHGFWKPRIWFRAIQSLGLQAKVPPRPC
jgi:cellulose synthase/poly-beta-1,6-N-acetylglucosamine synthase-like glycosyltransferase